MEVYASLLKRPLVSVEELSEILQKDRSTVYKALQNLLDKGLVEREYRILRGGGYKYLYKPIPFEKFREEMIKNINEWARRLIDFLDEFEKMNKEEIVQML
jgi:predicted transcriptional regulator